jgi:curli biogenesis system outer membrane secretion channel CsgG
MIRKLMRLSLLLLLVLAALSLASCITSTVSSADDYQRLSEQVRVAVIDFENKTKYGARRLSDAAAEILVSELSRSGNFIIVERDRLDEVLAELEFQLSDLSEGENSAEVGKILNVEYLITGVISNFGVKTEGRDMLIAKKKIQTATAEVDLKLIDVETAQIVYSAYGRGEAQKSIGSAFGVGGSGGYDETLAGDSLRAAIAEAVKRKIEFFSTR